MQADVPESVRKFFSRPADDECWIWSGAKSRQGYGVILIAIQAHRFAAQLAGLSIVGKQVRHKCDTPLCCNAAHLEVGTHADNMRDKKVRGRAARIGRVRIPEEHARLIRARYSERKHGDVKRIAKEFSVHPDTVRRIGLGLRRKGV